MTTLQKRQFSAFHALTMLSSRKRCYFDEKNFDSVPCSFLYFDIENFRRYDPSMLCRLKSVRHGTRTLSDTARSMADGGCCTNMHVRNRRPLKHATAAHGSFVFLGSGKINHARPCTTRDEGGKGP